MHVVRTISAALFVSIGGILAVSAQGLRATDEPAEFPPASYSGKQYVDSRGCVFIRAGFDGNVVWVPRVKRDRTLLCGFAPTIVAVTPPTSVGTNAPEVVVQASQVTPQPIATAPTAPRTRQVQVVGGTTVALTRRQITKLIVPKGFRLAWEDGRLNPDRGPRTEAGTAQMQQIWSNTVPRRLISPGDTVVVATRNSPQIIQSTKSTAGGTNGNTQTKAVKSGNARRFVQVAVYGEPANVNAAVARLQKFGLPVGLSKLRRNGKSYQVVLAGPFANKSDLNKGLSAARRSGFSDAFIRK